MSDFSDFITTVKQLMRLTRNGKIEWEKQPSEHHEGSPFFEGNYEDLTFRLRHIPAAEASDVDSAVRQTLLEDTFSTRYALEMHDESDDSVVTSPPMKAVTDLVHVIRGQMEDRKLNEINRRLGAS